MGYLARNLTDNNVAGVNTSAIRIQVFNYFNSAMNWAGNDAGSFGMSPMTGRTTAAAGAKIDLTLTSATTYSLLVTRLSDNATFTRTGTLGSSLPINYVNYRLTTRPPAGRTMWPIITGSATWKLSLNLPRLRCSAWASAVSCSCAVVNKVSNAL